jgi:hypothetical protein
LFTINCTGFSGKKNKLFSLVFQKKKKLNIATVEHGSIVPKNAASPILRLSSKN